MTVTRRDVDACKMQVKASKKWVCTVVWKWSEKIECGWSSRKGEKKKSGRMREVREF